MHCESSAHVRVSGNLGTLREIEGGIGGIITSPSEWVFTICPWFAQFFPTVKWSRDHAESMSSPADDGQRPANTRDCANILQKKNTKKSVLLVPYTRSIGVNGFSTTRRPRFSAGRCDACHHSYNSSIIYQIKFTLQTLHIFNIK